ncbi:MAG TPA: chemotaxis protein CheC [Candidatus Omnitrophota bacterium]|nr:chemotaxis protein CheC [Candidatus Omnitrophota bacterium]HQJ15066.1 chemotaxis protein CheC [Candidatus Omnitrophota bacterium]
MAEQLSYNQLDVLKEIGTIGSATAATALADMLASKVEISVPQVTLVPLENIGTVLARPDEMYFILDMEVQVDVRGRIFFLLPPEDAKFLAATLLSRPKEEMDFNDEMFKSALKEVCNILGGSYVSAMADMTKFTISISTPSMALDMIGAILDFIFIQIAEESDEALYIKTDITIKGLRLNGLFLLFPTMESLQKVFDSLNIK